MNAMRSYPSGITNCRDTITPYDSNSRLCCSSSCSDVEGDSECPRQDVSATSLFLVIHCGGFINSSLTLLSTETAQDLNALVGVGVS